MIDKNHRFQGYGSLRFVYHKGKTIRGPLCSLKYVINRRRTSYRVAVVVSRKVHKSAVVRNRIRRRIYEVIRLLGGRISGSYDLVLIAYDDQLATISSDRLREVVVEKLEKAGVLSYREERKPDPHAIVDTKGELSSHV